jgi:small-conductance mechanosensitive channel/CRP-like cAMP-binding protein
MTVVLECLATLAGAILLIIATHVAGRKLRRRRLAGVINLFWVAVAAALLGEFLSPVLSPAGRKGAQFIFWCAVTLGAVRVVSFVLVEAILPRRFGVETPKILRSLGEACAFLLFVVVIAREVLEIQLYSLLATSGVLILILGMALQDTLVNLFAGVSMTIQKSFELNDWVTLGGVTGRVVDFNWRATTIESITNELVVIPNSKIARETIVNLSAGKLGCEVRVPVPYEVPPNDARRVLEQTAHNIDGVLTHPVPVVQFVDYEPSWMVYYVHFFVRDYRTRLRAERVYRTHLWYRARRLGWKHPYNISHIISHTEPEPVEKTPDVEPPLDHLQGVPILEPLEPGELEKLAGRSTIHRYGSGEYICHAGEAGDSMYVILAGDVQVLLKDGVNEPVVAELRRGDSFGEMSLLTGEPRSASVRAEKDVIVLRIDRADFARILMQNPTVAEHLSQVLAERSEGLDQTRSLALAREEEKARREKSAHFFRRITSLFKLNG